MKLYEISHKLDDILDAIEEVGGEIGENESLVLNELELAYENKVEAIALVIKDMQNDQELIKQEEERLRARRKTLENREKWLRSYLANNMQSKVKTPIISVYTQKRTSVEISENFDLKSLVGLGLAKERIEYIPDKIAIKNYLSDVGGHAMLMDQAENSVQLVEKTSVVIR